MKSTAEVYLLAASDPEVAPIVQITSVVMTEGLSAASVESVGMAVGQVVLSVMIETLGEIVGESLGVMVGESVGEMIPLVEMFVGIAENPLAAVPGHKEKAVDCQNEYPQGGYVSPLPTGLGGNVTPYDLLVRETGVVKANEHLVNPAGERYPTGAVVPTLRPQIGRLLYRLTRPQSAASVDYARKTLGDSRLGLPASTRERLRDVLWAVERDLEDGGKTLWPYALELLRYAVNRGQLTYEYVRYLEVVGELESAGVGLTENNHGAALLAARFEREGSFAAAMGLWQSLPVDMRPRVTCARYDYRTVTAFFEMVRQWTATIEPRWKADQRNAAKILDVARQAFSDMRLELLAAAVALYPAAKRPRIKIGPV